MSANTATVTGVTTSTVTSTGTLAVLAAAATSTATPAGVVSLTGGIGGNFGSGGNVVIKPGTGSPSPGNTIIQTAAGAAALTVNGTNGTVTVAGTIAATTITGNGAGITGLVDTIGITVDGGGAVLTAGSKGFRQIEEQGTVTAWTVLGTPSGSVTFDVKQSSYANFPTNTSMVGAGAFPAVSAAQKSTSAPSGWTTTTVAGGDVLEFIITGTPATVTRATLMLQIQRT
ncbi:MAG: hypothetical protein M3349_04125 [Actinomycetota bacterium]|nr:hypothetical protein [Actinomycetota bacterium]